jgi:hypothetical protein
MKRILVFAVVAGALFGASPAGSQEARPNRFWVGVAPIGGGSTASPQNYDVVGKVAVPTTLVGWTCRPDEVALKQFAGTKASADGVVPFTPPSVYQFAAIRCSSASGTVHVTASCMLSASQERDFNSMTITDAAGHVAIIGIGCKN